MHAEQTGPANPSLLWYTLKKLIQLSIILPVATYFFLVVLMYTSPWARKQALYLNYAKIPFQDLSEPSTFGVENAVNFYIQGPAGRLGAWYIKAKSDDKFHGEIELNDGKPVVIYFHGNAYTRAEHHRKVLYKVLTSMPYHVVTIDYRGFADSDGDPTEQGLIDDGVATWNWVKSKSANSPVFIWGHSLGSAVATAVGKVLCDKGSPPSGVILEAPFNNVYDAGKDHKIAQPFKFLPFFEQFVLDDFKEVFRTDKRIVDVYCPILILHDREDDIIPFEYGEKLYQLAKQYRPNPSPVKLVEFTGHGHNWICDSKVLPAVLRSFIEGKKTI